MVLTAISEQVSHIMHWGRGSWVGLNCHFIMGRLPSWPCGGSNQMYGLMHIVRAPKQNISQCDICLTKGSLWKSLWVGQDVSILVPSSCVHRVDCEWKPGWIVTEVYFIHFIFIYSFYSSPFSPHHNSVGLVGWWVNDWLKITQQASMTGWRFEHASPRYWSRTLNSYAMLAYFLHWCIWWISPNSPQALCFVLSLFSWAKQDF